MLVSFSSLFSPVYIYRGLYAARSVPTVKRSVNLLLSPPSPLPPALSISSGVSIRLRNARYIVIIGVVLAFSRPLLRCTRVYTASLKCLDRALFFEVTPSEWV